MKKKAIIIGAGPAGLTAAYELLKRTDITPVILEKSGDIGGISKTINYKGNRMDMGPHRFFSKSDRVMNWWLNIMPLQQNNDDTTTIHYQNKSRKITTDYSATNPSSQSDKVMLLIKRLTRIYFLRRFFAYPIQLSFDTLRALGFIRTIKILISFIYIKLFPRKQEKSLEDFIINKFGRQLYLLFFKDYTEKVWGVKCHEISAEWGAQRIKGVSLSKAIGHAVKSVLTKKHKTGIKQKELETSLIEQFLYPKYGPGSLWEEVARQITEMGGRIYFHQNVQKIHVENNNITSINTINTQTDQTSAWEGNYFFSTMPVQELIAGMADVPVDVKKIAAGLQYRDFINVGILLKHLSTPGKTKDKFEKIELKDNWIYIQERDVKVGRLMIYNNWGGGMLNDPNTAWIGMEYFCNKTDKFWALSNDAIQQIAIDELEKMELARAEDVLDATVQRMEKTYPAYFGTYNQFDEIKTYINRFENLFLVGRNGMHKYNNSDHSMLTAMVAVDNICEGISKKENIWAINTEQEYHEEKTPDSPATASIPQKEQEPIRVPQPSISFSEFIWKKIPNRIYFIAGIFSLLLQFILFKLFYPFADYSNDSYTYIQAAIKNDSISIRPIGYSRFLSLFNIITESETALVCFQYLFIGLTTLGFFFTVRHFLNPSKKTTRTLFICLVFNPVSLYLGNYIGPDALFTGFSLIWFTHLIWIYNRFNVEDLLTQVILIFCLLTLRYNALYYPVITTMALLLSGRKTWLKFSGIVAGFLVAALFITYTSYKTQETTGTRTFSAFSGWQLANNALHVYSHKPVESSTIVPAEFQELNTTVEEYFRKYGPAQKQLPPFVTYDYMWFDNGPLKKYWHKYINKHQVTDSMKAWYAISPLLEEYGSYLIKKHPLDFTKYYLLPNVKKYFLPPLEILQQYNLGQDTVKLVARYWFGYNSPNVKATSKQFQKKLLQPLPLLFGLANIIFIVCFILFWVTKARKTTNQYSIYVLVLSGLFLFTNFCFSVFAAPNVFRYQFFPMILCTALCLLAIEMLSLRFTLKIKPPASHLAGNNYQTN